MRLRYSDGRFAPNPHVNGYFEQYLQEFEKEMPDGLSFEDQKKFLEKNMNKLLPKSERRKVKIEVQRIHCYIDNKKKWLMIIKA